jgi:F-type H+-transporting ATPase subunit epsilon
MAHTFHLTIAQVGQNLYDGEAVSVTLPGESGVFTVLAHHEAFVSPLKVGKAIIKMADDSRHEIELALPGIAEVSGNQATVLL